MADHNMADISWEKIRNLESSSSDMKTIVSLDEQVEWWNKSAHIPKGFPAPTQSSIVLPFSLSLPPSVSKQTHHSLCNILFVKFHLLRISPILPLCLAISLPPFFQEIYTRKCLLIEGALLLFIAIVWSRAGDNKTIPALFPSLLPSLCVCDRVGEWVVVCGSVRVFKQL